MKIHYILLTLIVPLFLNQAYASPDVSNHANNSSIVNQPLDPVYYVLICIAVVVIGFFSFGIVYATICYNRDYQERVTYEKEVIGPNKISNIMNVLGMSCLMCKKGLDRPLNLIKHLGIEQTNKYLQLCQESQIQPTLYCCQCYPLIERNPDWQKAFDETINNQIKTAAMRKLWENKISEIQIPKEVNDQ